MTNSFAESSHYARPLWQLFIKNSIEHDIPKMRDAVSKMEETQNFILDHPDAGPDEILERVAEGFRLLADLNTDPEGMRMVGITMQGETR